MPQPIRCQVAGCQDALPPGKAYYRRYRICTRHACAECMVLNGTAMRWCQQCGRFQEIVEFDDDKRTCRQRLTQHNAQRKLARMRRTAAARSHPAAIQAPAASQDSPPQASMPIASGDSTPCAAPAAPSSDASHLPSGAVELSGSLCTTAIDALDGIDADVDTLLGILEAPAPAPSATGPGIGVRKAHPQFEQSDQTEALSMTTLGEYSRLLFGLEPEALPAALLHSLIAVLAARGTHARGLGKLFSHIAPKS